LSWTRDVSAERVVPHSSVAQVDPGAGAELLEPLVVRARQHVDDDVLPQLALQRLARARRVRRRSAGRAARGRAHGEERAGLARFARVGERGLGLRRQLLARLGERGRGRGGAQRALLEQALVDRGRGVVRSGALALRLERIVSRARGGGGRLRRAARALGLGLEVDDELAAALHLLGRL
jgi:hypothetical protein